MNTASSRWRGTALALTTAMLLAACASEGDDGAEPTSASDVEVEPSDMEVEPSETEATTEGGTDPTEAAAPTSVTVDTYFGDPVEVPYQPATVVVMDYAVLDTLDHLGLGDAVVGIPSGTSLPPHLAGYADTTQNIGNLFEPDFEAINALEPDLILAGGRSQALVPELAEIAPTVDITFEWGSQPFVDSLLANTVAIGQIFGVEAEATSALEEINDHAADVATQAADDGTGLVVMTGGGEVSAYGPSEEGRFDFVYNLLGVQPAAEQVAIDTHGDAVSFEFLAEADPDLLIVLDRDAAIGEEGASAAQILDNDLVNATSAVQDGKVVYVDTAKWYLAFGGLNAVGTMVDEVDSIVD